MALLLLPASRFANSSATCPSPDQRICQADVPPTQVAEGSFGLRVSSQDHATIGEWHCCLVQEGHFREPVGQQRARPIGSTCKPAQHESRCNLNSSSTALQLSVNRTQSAVRALKQEIFPPSLAERNESLGHLALRNQSPTHRFVQEHSGQQQKEFPCPAPPNFVFPRGPPPQG